jgi:8-oxo-dGTP pyrophosphatase MutT (NUDIX family)
MKRIFENFYKKDNRNGDVVTFDFDQTVVKSFMNKNEDGQEQYQYGGVNKEIIKRIKSFKGSGKTTFIVTSRQKHLDGDGNSVKSLLDKLKIEVDGVFYTNGQPKAQKLYELGSTLHFDDDPKEHEAIEAYKNLHKDFKITVKYPDDLINDIKAVSKGVILTADGKILIGQRSDSLEWDAPGGHIMQGEEANYSFWREVKEELGIEMDGVEFLDKTETTWEGVTKDTFYFIGKLDKTCDELEGVLKLQWEIEEYMCDSWEEIQRNTKGNQTQHLTSMLSLLQSQQYLMERNYQKTSTKIKSYNKDSNELLSTGPHTKGSPYKNMKIKRGKSAPPGAPGGGWGALEEEKEEKTKKTYKIKIKSTIKEKKKKKYSVHGGKYYDFSFLDTPSGENSDDGEE